LKVSASIVNSGAVQPEFTIEAETFNEPS
jgi:hypothetical protein